MRVLPGNIPLGTFTLTVFPLGKLTVMVFPARTPFGILISTVLLTRRGASRGAPE